MRKSIPRVAPAPGDCPHPEGGLSPFFPGDPQQMGSVPAQKGLGIESDAKFWPVHPILARQMLHPSMHATGVGPIATEEKGYNNEKA